MTNPWRIDEADIPADRRAQARRRRLRIAGLGLWGLFAGSITVLLVSGTDDLTTAEIASLFGLTVGTAIVLGGLALLVLRYLPSIIAKAVFVVIFLFVLSLVLPQVVSLALEEVTLFEDIPTDTEQPLLDLLDIALGE